MLIMLSSNFCPENVEQYVFIQANLHKSVIRKSVGFLESQMAPFENAKAFRNSPRATSSPCHPGHDNRTILDIYGHTRPARSAVSGIFVLILLTIFSALLRKMLLMVYAHSSRSRLPTYYSSVSPCCRPPDLAWMLPDDQLNYAYSVSLPASVLPRAPRILRRYRRYTDAVIILDDAGPVV